jgi:ethanolamine permease
MGPIGGYATGTAILIEYAVAPAAIVIFIGGYIEALGLFGLTNSWPVYLVAYVIFVGIHLRGVGEALKVMFAITAVAVVGLVIFAVAMIPQFDADNLFDIVPTSAAGASEFLPFGYAGVLAAFVYGIWFFLAIEGVPLAAEEARDPRRDMPRGIITAMLVLLVFAAMMLVLAPGGAGSSTIAESANPLPDALRAAYGGNTWAADAVNYIGLAGLVASFFSIIFAYSRQLFALSRAGYLPRILSTTGKRRTPWVALIVPGTIGFLLAALVSAAVGADVAGARMIQIAVFGASVSYILMMVSHIVLRRREPELARPYRTPGGVGTTGVALVLAVAAFVAVFLVDITAALITLAVFVAFLAYFLLYSRHHLVGVAPEEEFEAIRSAESELN